MARIAPLLVLRLLPLLLLLPSSTHASPVPQPQKDARLTGTYTSNNAIIYTTVSVSGGKVRISGTYSLFSPIVSASGALVFASPLDGCRPTHVPDTITASKTPFILVTRLSSGSRCSYREQAAIAESMGAVGIVNMAAQQTKYIFLQELTPEEQRNSTLALPNIPSVSISGSTGAELLDLMLSVSAPLSADIIGPDSAKSESVSHLAVNLTITFISICVAVLIGMGLYTTISSILRRRSEEREYVDYKRLVGSLVAKLPTRVIQDGPKADAEAGGESAASVKNHPHDLHVAENATSNDDAVDKGGENGLESPHASRGLDEGREDDEDVCAVCLDKFEAGQTARILPCRHEFHQTCVDPWLLENCNCPLCKFHLISGYTKPAAGASSQQDEEDGEEVAEGEGTVGSDSDAGSSARSGEGLQQRQSRPPQVAREMSLILIPAADDQRLHTGPSIHSSLVAHTGASNSTECSSESGNTALGEVEEGGRAPDSGEEKERADGQPPRLPREAVVVFSPSASSLAYLLQACDSSTV